MKDIIDMIITYWPYFLKGTGITVFLSFFAVIFSTVIGTAAALANMSRFKILHVIASVYISVFRGTPMIVQLWIFSLQLTELISFPDVMVLGMDMSRTLPCLIALSLNSGAYVAEIVRAGIQAVDSGQMEAARSIGMPKWLAMKEVILPQAVKNILPAIGNEFVTMIKETAIIQYLGIPDLMYNRNAVAVQNYQVLQSYYIAGAIYFVLTFITSKGVNRLERSLNRIDHR